MKCENWSNKVNNFVVRKLKSFKLNGRQQVLSTMPAMPKEKTSPVPLTECNFVEMKMKEQFMGSPTAKMPETILSECCTNKAMHQQQQQKGSALATPTQTNKIYSSCNDICSTKSCSVIRKTSLDEIGTTATTSRVNDLITSSNSTTTISSLVNGSTGSLFNSKNEEMNNKNLNNGSISTTYTGSYYDKIKTHDITKQMNNLSTISSTTANPDTVTTTASSSSSSSTTQSSSSVKPNLTGVKNNLNQGPSSSSTAKSHSGMPAKKSAKDYIFGKIIGEGSFSTVCLARDIHTNREYAIKICYKPHILREKKQEYVRREREVMHVMNNVPGFVNLSCTFQDYRNLYFVMTLAKNGDLLPYINKVGSFDLDCTRHYAAELVLAIENMHKRGVIHRDLKPENILLDENMHTLIADFGSAKVFDVNSEKEKEEALTLKETSTITTATTTARSTATSNYPDKRMTTEISDVTQEKSDNDDDDDSPRPIRRRKGSFVGTAQYVSPEVLHGEIVTRTADLWALGCIIYQMISGLPPFRGGSDYLIFKEITNLNLIFPEGFDKNAEELVRNLLKLNPDERLGAKDSVGGKYVSIRSHPFFNGIEWDKIRKITPPPIYPYLPGNSKDEELRSHYRVPDNLEPGLDDRQLTRLLGLELGTITGGEKKSTTRFRSPSSTITEKKTEPKNNLNVIECEKQKRLELQQRTDKWHSFAEGELILKKGLVNKRKGLFARKRMLLLTTGPRLIYIDPVQMVKKGEIPWSPELRVEPKNFKIFFVHTPNRTYYLEDPEGYALEWVNAIEDIRQKTYGDKS